MLKPGKINFSQHLFPLWEAPECSERGVLSELHLEIPPCWWHIVQLTNFSYSNSVPNILQIIHSMSPFEFRSQQGGSLEQVILTLAPQL